MMIFTEHFKNCCLKNRATLKEKIEVLNELGKRTNFYLRDTHYTTKVLIV